MHEQYRLMTAADFPALSALHRAYKEAIGEAAPTEEALSRLRDAMDRGDILFFGCEAEGRLVRFAREESGVSTLTVGCAPCDRGMYEAIGFRVPLGTLLAWSDGNT